MTQEGANVDMLKAHQYIIKQNTLEEDLEAYGLSRDQVNSIRIPDLTFNYTNDPDELVRIRNFITRYEWLGKPSLYPTHYFTAYWGNILVCAVTMDMPAAFSKMLGKNTRKLERLISRGASISFAPKNTASAILSWAMRWMIENTGYRLFTAYADPEAGELGTIYQALNFYYLGNNYGTSVKYLYKGRWVSDRTFRSRSAYKRYAKALGITWKPEWQHKERILWYNMPEEIENKLRQASKDFMGNLEKKTGTKKHKYAYVLGSDKRETRKLRQLFLDRNKIYAYPKERGK